MEPLVPLLVVVPLGVAFAIVGMAHARVLRRLVAPISVVAVLGALVLSVALLAVDVEPIFVGGWTGVDEKTLWFELVFDGLAKLLLVTINMVALVNGQPHLPLC